jgi:hypothetical protein
MTSVEIVQPRTPVRTLRGTALVTCMAAGLAALADWLFYGQFVGWTAGLFTLLAAAAIVAYRPWVLRRRAGLVLIAMIAGVAGAMVAYPGVLEILVALALLVMLSHTARYGWRPEVPAWIDRWLVFAFAFWTRALVDLRLRRRRAEPGSGSLVMGKWGLAAVLGLIFTGLFAMANPVIESWLSTVWSWVASLPEYIGTPRPVFWLVMFLFGWALLRPGRVGRASQLSAGLVEADGRSPVPMDVVVRCLIVFNLLFAVQTTLDAMYLAGGTQLPEGMTYKEYARRGAYPLVATTLLAAGFVLVTFRSRGYVATPRVIWARRLVYIWIAQNIALLITAAWRLYLLVDVSMLTRLRIASVIWMAIVAIGFVAIVVRIVQRRPNAWLVQFMGAVAGVTIYACCFVNFDAIIANVNARHCYEATRGAEAQRFYIPYHLQLGYESLPAMRRLQATVQGENDFQRALSEAIAQLERDLVERQQSWRGWTWRGASVLATSP